MSARGHACPRCGAPVDEGARRCGYCAAPIAAVRCAVCFHMSPPHAVHCSGCGHELGLEPVAEPGKLRCPDCGEPLAMIREGGAALHDCAACGGQLVEHAMLRAMIQRREVPGAEVAPPPPRRAESEARVRYRPCPACGQLMNRTNFGGSSGVIVDTCREHGTWFDRGELPRVMAFVAAGGMARSRQKQAEERERARQAEISLRTGAAGAMNAPAERSSFGAELGVLEDLLSYLKGILPKR